MKWITGIVLFLLFFISLIPVFGCSAFMFTRGDQSYFGKNLDWSVGEGIVMVNPRGVKRRGKTYGDAKPAVWTSRYGSITFNQFGHGHPLGGMNEIGLVIEELSFTPSRFPAPNGVARLNEFQWIQYFLDNCKSVKEVVKKFGDVSIRKVLTGLHYLLGDPSGDCAVVEFINGTIRVYSGKNLPIPILTNNRYDRMLSYLKHYSGFGGEKSIPTTVDSPSRFIILAAALKNTKNILTSDPVDTAYGFLGSVKQEDTRWSIVYDISNMRITFRTDRNRECSLIDLREFSFHNSLPEYMKIYRTGPSEIPISDFKVVSPDAVSAIVLKVLLKLMDGGDVSAHQFQELKSIFLPSE